MVRGDDAASQAAELPDWMRRRIDAPEAVEVVAADADTAALFLALDTQWRRHPMTGERMGLDYVAIGPTAALFGLSCTPPGMRDLRAMELAALDAFARAARPR